MQMFIVVILLFPYTKDAYKAEHIVSVNTSTEQVVARSRRKVKSHDRKVRGGWREKYIE